MGQNSTLYRYNCAFSLSRFTFHNICSLRPIPCVRFLPDFVRGPWYPGIRLSPIKIGGYNIGRRYAAKPPSCTLLVAPFQSPSLSLLAVHNICLLPYRILMDQLKEGLYESVVQTEFFRQSGTVFHNL